MTRYRLTGAHLVWCLSLTSPPPSPFSLSLSRARALSLSLSLSGGRARDRVLGLLITTLRRGPQTFGFGSAVVIYKTRILDRVTTWEGVSVQLAWCSIAR